MSEEKENIIVKKSYAFALEIIKLYKDLTGKKSMFFQSKFCGAELPLELIFTRQLAVNRKGILFTRWG